MELQYEVTLSCLLQEVLPCRYVDYHYALPQWCVCQGLLAVIMHSNRSHFPSIHVNCINFRNQCTLNDVTSHCWEQALKFHTEELLLRIADFTSVVSHMTKEAWINRTMHELIPDTVKYNIRTFLRNNDANKILTETDINGVLRNLILVVCFFIAWL